MGQIVKGNLLTYFNLIFAILAILVIAAGSFRSLTFLPVVVANLFIGILQEIRAKKTLDQLTMLNAPKAEVVRNGHISEIPAEELVLDDIVIFRGGDQICADAIVLEGSVLVNEAEAKMIGITPNTKLQFLMGRVIQENGSYDWHVSGAGRFFLDNIVISK